MEKLRKARVLKIRSYVLTRVSTLTPNQNLIIKLKNLGYLKFLNVLGTVASVTAVGCYRCTYPKTEDCGDEFTYTPAINVTTDCPRTDCICLKIVTQDVTSKKQGELL